MQCFFSSSGLIRVPVFLCREVSRLVNTLNQFCQLFFYIQKYRAVQLYSEFVSFYAKYFFPEQAAERASLSPKHKPIKGIEM